MKPEFLLFIPLIQIILGGWVFLREPRNAKNWSFGFLMISVAGWATMNFIVNIISDELIVLTARLAFMFGSLIAGFLVVFGLSLGDNEKLGKVILTPLLPSFFFAILSLTSSIVENYQFSPWGLVPYYGWAHPFFAGYFVSFVLVALVILMMRFRSSRGIERYKLSYIFFGTTISTLAGTFTNLIWPMISKISNISTVGPAASIFFTVFTAYAILKYRFLDVRVIIRKSFVYSLLIAIFFGFIVFFVAVLTRALENSLDISVWASAAILAVLLSAAYFPFHRTIQRVVTSLFTHAQPPFASPTLPPDVEEMKIKAGALIRKSIPVENAEMLFLAELPSRGWAKKEIENLQTYFTHTTKALLLQEIPYVRTDGNIPPENLDHVERVLFSKDLAMIIPLYDHEIKLFACMLVGPKAKGIFLADEISYLEAFARTLALRVDQILSETIVFENNRA